MGRMHRISIPQVYYHIVTRGVRQEALFRDDLDYSVYMYIVNQTYKEINFKLPAYCLMTNHTHLLLSTTKESISKLMSVINKSYAHYFNNLYGYTGHVFEKNFYSSPIYTHEGLLKVSRYIHLNPLKANIVKEPEQYPWSSYQFYKNPQICPPTFINIQEILQLTPSSENIDKARLDYCEFVEEIDK